MKFLYLGALVSLKPSEPTSKRDVSHQAACEIHAERGWQIPQWTRPLQGWGAAGTPPAPAPAPARLRGSVALPASGKLAHLRKQTKKFWFKKKKKPQRGWGAHQPPRCERRPSEAPQEGRGRPGSPRGGRGAPPQFGPGHGGRPPPHTARAGVSQQRSAPSARSHGPAFPHSLHPGAGPGLTARPQCWLWPLRHKAPLADREAPRPPSVLPAGGGLWGRGPGQRHCMVERPPAAGTQMAGDGRRKGTAVESSGAARCQLGERRPAGQEGQAGLTGVHGHSLPAPPAPTRGQAPVRGAAPA